MKPEHKEIMKARKRNIRLTVSYDGTAYNGFQRQNPPQIAVQNVLEEKLQQVCGDTIELAASGRTDAGVHALGQVANFRVPKMLVPIERVHIALNSCLPKDIRIISAEIMPDDFNARASANFREYLYIVYNGDISYPFYERYAWFYRKNIINEKLINEYAKYLIGEHNFTSFCSTEDENDSKFRYIERVFAIRKKDIIYLVIRGNAFLHNMVRIMVGTLIEGQRKNKPINFIEEIIKEEDRTKALVTAPAHGLYFRKAFFEY